MFQHRVADGLQVIIRFQIFFGHIGGLGVSMNEHMIPGPVFRGTRLCDGFVPFICCLEITINIYNYPTIVEKPVVNEFTNGEFNPGNVCYSSHVFLTAVGFIRPQQRARALSAEVRASTGMLNGLLSNDIQPAELFLARNTKM